MSNTDAGSGSLPPNAATDHLPDDPVILKRMILELLATLREERHEREEMRARLHHLLQRLYGPRTERFDPNQPLLFPELSQLAEAAPLAAPQDPATAEQPAERSGKRGHGRKQLPKELPHEPVHHRLSEAERALSPFP
jgi:hypothetical protein